MEFQLKQQAAKVAHVNLRIEKHGEEEVLACDVKIEADVPNTFLDQLSPTLRSSLYMAEGEAPAPGQIPLVADATHLPVLRYPFMGEQRFPGVEMFTATAHFHTRPKVTIAAKVNDLRATLKEGGTVELQFRLQFVADADQVAKLSSLLGREVKISVGPEGSGEHPHTEE
jgi:hypothetical protein